MIKVVAHSGYRGEEYPKAIIIEDVRHEVSEIIKQWIEPGKRYFRIKINKDSIYTVYYDEDLREWFSGDYDSNS
ncbi:MAG: hypothetical protein HZC12_01475 [Nitrospirae bacterium]|nr:hypothetical protein [Nitrospirota bacterium]